jgi:hypothetical protein
MQTQLWRPNVEITEHDENNLFHLGADELEPITPVRLLAYWRSRTGW